MLKQYQTQAVYDVVNDAWMVWTDFRNSRESGVYESVYQFSLLIPQDSTVLQLADILEAGAKTLREKSRC